MTTTNNLANAKSEFAKRLIIENTKISFEAARARIRLDCKKPDKFDELGLDCECKPTDLVFAVRFSPVMTRAGAPLKLKMEKPFLLKCKMIRPKGQIRLYGYEDMTKCDNEIVKWIRENCIVSESTFRMALENPYLWIPFSLDYEAYAKKTGTYAMTDYGINHPYEGPPIEKTGWEESKAARAAYGGGIGKDVKHGGEVRK